MVVNDFEIILIDVTFKCFMNFLKSFWWSDDVLYNFMELTKLNTGRRSNAAWMQVQH